MNNYSQRDAFATLDRKSLTEMHEAARLLLLIAEADLLQARLTLRANKLNSCVVGSDEERRLALEYVVRVENEETGQLEPVPAEQCTTLVEDGGSQMMTFSIDLPSEVYGPYQFVVPGLDDQSGPPSARKSNGG